MIFLIHFWQVQYVIRGLYFSELKRADDQVVVPASDIPVIKAVEEVMDPAAFSAVRFIMSAIPFLPFVFRARGDVKTRNAGIELGLWVSLGYFVEALGLLTSDAGRASFLSLFTVSSAS